MEWLDIPGKLSDNALYLQNQWIFSFGNGKLLWEKWDNLSTKEKHKLQALMDDGLFKPKEGVK